jgi:hypothetical protein
MTAVLGDSEHRYFDHGCPKATAIINPSVHSLDQS